MKAARAETVLITGASAGLGAEFARQMAPSSARLILVARRLERLEQLKLELELELKPLNSGLEILCWKADLTESVEVEEILEKIRAQEIHIDWLVNNAGLGDMGNFATSDWARTAPMVQVNVMALTRLTHALVPGMVARGRGRIIQVGSVAGYLAMPSFATYAATKAYVNSFSEALYWELRGTGVSVTAVCPGPVETEFVQVASRGGGQKSFNAPSFAEESAVKVVRESLECARAGRPRVVPGFCVWAGAGLLKILPMWWMRILYRFRIIS